MEETISAADANRRFSRILSGVRDGRRYLVTSHGTPVARIIPAERTDRSAAAARAALLSRLERQIPAEASRWTRDELYEDDE